LQDKRDVPETPSTILDSPRVHVRPVVGDTVSVMLTVPAKPSRLATVRVEFPLRPVFTINAVVPAVTVKSWTV